MDSIPFRATGACSGDDSSLARSGANNGARADRLDRLDSLWRYLGYGLHVLVAALWAVVVVTEGPGWRALLFATVYVAGIWVRPRWAWVLAVVVAWALMVAVWPSAAFIAFALFFLAIGVLPPRLGVAAVGGITLIAVLALARANGFAIGGVIGPVVGALVAVALGLGFRALRREAQARAEASHHAGEMGERARVAADIHDTVAQGLSSIHMLLSSVERRLYSDATAYPSPEDLSKAREQIRLARETTEANLAETRRIIAALQPAPLEQADLPVALARVVSTTPMGKALSLTVDGQPYALSSEVAEALVRMTQSLVSNVVRHSGADTARVTLTYHDDRVSLDVVDNGRGFTVDRRAVDQESTVGLAGVRRRAEACGGAMEIETVPGHGCGVVVSIPATRARAEAGSPAGETVRGDAERGHSEPGEMALNAVAEHNAAAELNDNEQTKEADA